MADGQGLISSDVSILLIDDEPIARRYAIVGEAAKEGLATNGAMIGRNIDIQFLRPSQKPEITQFIKNEKPYIALIVITEEELSLLPNEKIPRIPCDSIAVGYELVDRVGVANDIYFVVRDITGVDVISLLLSGARGVIDSKALGEWSTLQTLIAGISESDKRLNRILIGQPYRELKSLKEMAHGRWQLAPQHWSMLLALAEIPVLRFSISDNKPKQNQIAREMSKWVEVTGYVVPEVAARRLPTLLTLVTGELEVEDSEVESDVHSGKRRALSSAEMFELPYLPMYVRELGFPSRLIPIRGLDQTQLVTRLLKGLRGIEVVSTLSRDSGNTIAWLTIPREL